MKPDSHRFSQGYAFSMDGHKGEAVGYLQFPGHPGMGVTNAVKRSLRLSDLIGLYLGPDVIIDFDGENRLIAIEIVE